MRQFLILLVIILISGCISSKNQSDKPILIPEATEQLSLDSISNDREQPISTPFTLSPSEVVKEDVYPTTVPSLLAVRITSPAGLKTAELTSLVCILT